MRSLSTTLTAASLVCLLAAPAHARSRVFVASYGNDANACTFSLPCRNFQAAVNAVDAGGEVTAIDSAGFGPVNITKAVTISSPSGVEAGITAVEQGVAVNIAAGNNDTVVLSGLSLLGANLHDFGINFSSGLRLEIVNCTIRGFRESGIQFNPNSFASILISNTTIADTGLGISLSGFLGGAGFIASLDHITAVNNGSAIWIASGPASVEALIKDSSIDNNVDTGIKVVGYCGSSASSAVLRNVSLNQNPNPIFLDACANVYLSHVVQTLAPGFPYNPGVLFGNTGGSHAFSDGTNLTSAPPNSFEVWNLQ